MTVADLTSELERTEAIAWADFYSSADEEIAAELGVRVVQLPMAMVTLASSFDVLAFNRAMGIGLDAPLDARGLDRILSVFHDADLERAMIQVSPEVLDDRLASLLESRGLSHHNRWLKLWRGTGAMPDVMTDLEIVEIGPERGLEFGAVVVSSFEWPSGIERLIARAVGRRDWRHYAALHGGRIVATGASFVRDGFAWLDFAATLPDARGMGAQSALLERRIRDLREAGCEWVMVETSEPRPDNPAQSYRNVTRMGFEVAYARSNFLWTRS